MRGYSLVDCGADFRLFWLQSKLAEEDEGSWSLDGRDESQDMLSGGGQS